MYIVCELGHNWGETVLLRVHALKPSSLYLKKNSVGKEKKIELDIFWK